MIIDIQSLYGMEMEWIRHLHMFRTPMLDSFIKLLDYFDNYQFFFVLVPIVWIWGGWRNGFKLFSIILISSLTNYELKEIFLYPRPYHLDPSLGVITVSGTGFPSGAAQTVALLSGIIITAWKSPWKWPVAAFYLLSVSFSRVYLGLHFPTDILAGWCVGLMLWLIYQYVFPRIEASLENRSPLLLLVLSQAVPFSLNILLPSDTAIRITSSLMGMGFGVFLSYVLRLIPSSSLDRKGMILRSILGVCSMFIVYEALRIIVAFSSVPLTLFVRFYLLGFWTSFGVGAILCCRVVPWSCNSSKNRSTL